MIVGAIKHISDEGAESYISRLEKGLSFFYNINIRPEIIIGPDYALSGRNGSDIDIPHSLRERQEIFKQIKEISKNHPQTRIIPGTMFWHDSTNAYLSAPMYSAGKMLQEFYKERSNGEWEAAERQSLHYMKGDNRKNRFIKDGKNISVEICGDHGTQKVQDVDLQLILSYDNMASFYVGINNDNSSRYGLVCNGYNSTVKLNFYDVKTHEITDIAPTFSHPLANIYKLSRFDTDKKVEAKK